MNNEYEIYIFLYINSIHIKYNKKADKSSDNEQYKYTDEEIKDKDDIMNIIKNDRMISRIVPS